MRDNTAKDECFDIHGVFEGEKRADDFRFAPRDEAWEQAFLGESGYYVDTVGRNEELIRKYIREQEDADQIEDNVN
jgi:hypothetical protein